MGFKGVDSRQSGDRIVFRASLKDSSGVKVTTGTASLYLYEVQSDGTLKSYDFSSNTFKTTALTTETQALTHRTGNNSTTNTGIWTYALATVSGFTRGNVYIAVVSHSSASPAQQEREFQYGEGEGDFTVNSTGQTTAASVAGDVNGKILGNTPTDIGGVGAYVLNSGGGEVAGYDQIGVAGSNLTALPDPSGVTTLLGRVTAAVATAAGQTSILTAIANLNNLSALANLYGPQLMEIPDSGSTAYPFTIVTRDNEGKLKDLDASPTIAASNAAGTDRSANLSAVTRTGLGRYTFTYSVTSSATEEGLRITGDGTISTEARHVEYIGTVVDYDPLTAINAIKAKTDQLTFTNPNKVDSTAITVSDKSNYSLATAPPTAAQIRTEMDANSTQLAAIATSASTAATSAASADTKATAIQTKTDNLPANTKNWLGALAGKTADTATRAEINATTAGATFNETTDSQEALRDRGDAAWTTGTGGTGGGTGSGANPIDHNGGTGVTVDGVASTTDILQYLNPDTSGADGLFVAAYLATEYDANPPVRTAKGTTRTGPDGRWLAPLMLDSGTYYVIADTAGDGYEAKINTVVVP